MERIFFGAGSILAFLGVALGAFGAHGLKAYFQSNPDLQPVFKTATDYHLMHSLAILAAGWASGKWPGAWTHTAGYLFIAGVILFSGSLYAYTLTRLKTWGMIAPIGGLSFMVGWLCLAIGAFRGGR